MRRYKAIGQFPVGNSGQERPESLLERRSILTTVLIPLGSVLVAGLGLLVQNVPWWVTVLVVGYIIVITIVGLVPPTAEFYRKLRGLIIRRAIVRRYRPLVRRFVTSFMSCFEEARADTVFNAWKSAVPLDEGRMQIRPDYAHLRTLSFWLASINARLIGGNKEEFGLLCDELADVVSQYGSLCEQAHREIEAVVVAVKPEEHRLRSLRHEWNNARDKHNQTVKAWEDLAKSINHDSDQKVCRDYYAVLKAIV